MSAPGQFGVDQTPSYEPPRKPGLEQAPPGYQKPLMKLIKSMQKLPKQKLPKPKQWKKRLPYY